MKTLFLSGSILAVLTLLQAAGVAPSSSCPDDGKKPKLAHHDATLSACPGDDKAPKPPSIAS